MKLGREETGKVLNGEILNYFVKFNGNVRNNVSLRLKSYSGNADLYVKRCPFYTCHLNKADIKKLIYKSIYK